MEKQTTWQELDGERCEVICRQVGEYTGNINAIRVRHPDLKRVRWFQLSARGNWYSRYTGRELDNCAEGIIIKDLPLATISQAPTNA